MGNVIEIPLTRFYQRYMCTACSDNLFEIAESPEGKLIAVCASCEVPTTSLDCPCVIDYEVKQDG